jgi:hypothetical protein
VSQSTHRSSSDGLAISIPPISGIKGAHSHLDMCCIREHTSVGKPGSMSWTYELVRLCLVDRVLDIN